MKKYYSKITLVFITAFMLNILTGCSGEGFDTSAFTFTANASDASRTDNIVRTKVVNDSFDLTTLYTYGGSIGIGVSLGRFSTSWLANDIRFSGSASYHIFSNGIALSTERFIPITGASGAVTDSFSIDTAVQDAYVRTGLCVSSYNVETTTIDLIFTRVYIPTGRVDIALTPYNLVTNSPACGSLCDSTTPANTACYFDVTSVDHFAVRPEHFDLSAPNLDSVTSAADINIDINAVDVSNADAYGYNSSTANTIATTYYMSDTLEDTTGLMTGTAILSTIPTFIDGVSTDATVNFDNVGKISMSIQDRSWSSIDNGDGTPQDCSASGAYICGDINATFIPAEFTFDTITVKNANNKTFTYFSNDIDNNMSASMDIVLNARNANGDIVTNFTKGLWEEEMIITLAVSTANIPSLIKTEIDTPLALAFINGSKTIAWDVGDTSEQLKFNFAREIQTPLNPIKVEIGELSLNASASYPTGDVTGTATATNSITFTYARSHAPRQRFNATSGTDRIYFEVFCSGTDNNGVSCDKTLLPNSIASKFTDDPRWFVNSLHTPTEGIVGAISQKGTSKTTVSSVSAGTGVTSALINYTGSSYPYKATMQNTASAWLIYDKYSTAAAPTTTNKFEIEFVKAASSWAGTGENSASTAFNGATKTNRRTMW